MKHLLLAALAAASLGLFADDLIVVGSGGNPAYQATYDDWGARLRDTLVGSLGRKPEQVVLLREGGEGEARADATGLAHAFAQLASRHDANKTLFVYLIGHGSYLRGEARFQLPGPDVSPEQFRAWCDKVPAREVVLFNGTEASAPFINVLSAPRRIVCTATRSGSEQNAAEFMGFFVQALEENAADRDQDGRISVWEAARQASVSTAAWYKEQGLIATEHALLDDNGDQLGTRLVAETDPTHISAAEREAEPDGAFAHTVYLKDFIWPEGAPRALIDAYLAQVAEAVALRGEKARLGDKAYRDRFEQLMTAAAKTHQKIRAYAPGTP